jgi:ectoine hydroxylase
MRLTRQQTEQFDRDGYLFFPGLFSAEEMAAAFPGRRRGG